MMSNILHLQYTESRGMIKGLRRIGKGISVSLEFDAETDFVFLQNLKIFCLRNCVFVGLTTLVGAERPQAIN